MRRTSPLQKKLEDNAFEQRFNARFVEHFLMLLPLLVYITIDYRASGALTLSAVAGAAASYLLLSGVFYYRARREVLRALRREGVVDADYQPPF